MMEKTESPYGELPIVEPPKSCETCFYVDGKGEFKRCRRSEFFCSVSVHSYSRDQCGPNRRHYVFDESKLSQKTAMKITNKTVHQLTWLHLLLFGIACSGLSTVIMLTLELSK